MSLRFSDALSASPMSPPVQMHYGYASSTEIVLASLGVEDGEDQLPTGKRLSAVRSGDATHSDTSSPRERIERKRRSIELECASDGVSLRALVPPVSRAARFWHVHKIATEFKILTPLGTGTFGRVMLARRVDSGQLCAVKRVLKAHVLRFHQELRLLNERLCLRAFDSPFIVQYYGSFADERHLYFFLEYLPGGELFTRIHTAKRGPGKRGLKPSHARFYAAEVILALEYMHAWNVLYRDLKPENIMLDIEGHVRLVDLGFASQTVTRSYSVVGTTEYLAPEMILGRGINAGGDWWAVGVLIYEMIVGYTPFKAGTKMACYQRIIQEEVSFPLDWPTRSGKSLIRALLQKQPAVRLGVTKGGVSLIKKHEFFADLDWSIAARRELEPPWTPRCTSSEDARHFQTSGQNFDDPDITLDELGLDPSELEIFDNF